MAQTWHKSRMIQAALITGVFVVIAAIITAISNSSRHSYPDLQIRSVAQGSEEVLARLALDPRGKMIDSLDFTRLRTSLLVSDSLGVAIERPDDQEWTAGDVGSPGVVAVSLVPLVGAFADEVRKAWEMDKWPRPSYFGVRLDQPSKIRILPSSKVHGMPVGPNPFDDKEFADAILRFSEPDSPTPYSSAERDSVVREMRRGMDSIIRVRVPKDTTIYSGVFVSSVSERNLPPIPLLNWKYQSLFERVVPTLTESLDAPDFLYVDRDAGTALYNERIRLDDVLVNGVAEPSVIVNRAGYAVNAKDRVYLVELQYVSTEPREVLNKLQQYFKSVRLKER